MPTANAITLAMYRAKIAVKLDLQAQGHKVPTYSAAEINRLAKAYLTDDFIADTAKLYADILAPRARR
jgi:hypothetical protein